MTEKRFEKQIALVSGASRGLGAGIALALGAAGATVLGTATTPEGAEQITARFAEAKIQGKGYCLNVRDADAVTATVQQMEQDFGAPRLLVNNAGITRDNILLRMKSDQWQDVIDTNLSGVYRMIKACLKPMVKARAGRIVNLTSIIGFTGNFGQANYAAAKAGLVGFTKSLAMELAPYGITANCVAPGFIDTDMTRALTEKQREFILERVPLKKIGTVQDVANAVLFLLSEQAAYLTGQTLHVNGGMLML